MYAAAVRDGEWWRAVTATTLHSGLPHILANTVFGTIFGIFVGRSVGSGYGWLLVLLAAAAGTC